MDFLFNTPLQYYIAIGVALSSILCVVLFVISATESSFARLRAWGSHRAARKQQIDTATPSQPIAFVHIPSDQPSTDISPVTQEDSEMDDIPPKQSSEHLQAGETPIVASEIDISHGAHIAGPVETYVEATVVMKDEGEGVELISDEAPSNLLPENESIERIRKPEKSALLGDIFMSNQPHTAHIDTSGEYTEGEHISEIVSPVVTDELIEEIKTHIRRKELQKANTLIIEGLSYEKYHSVLNSLLAQVYEIEGDYHRAEILYADIIRRNGKSSELLSKLALMLSFSGKYQTSLDLYEEARDLGDVSDETTVMIMNLASFLEQHDKSRQVAGEYLLRYPRHIDTLELQAKNALALKDQDLFEENIRILRSLAGFDARTHARVADLMRAHDENSGEAIDTSTSEGGLQK